MSFWTTLQVDIYDQNLDLLETLDEHLISASATRPLDRIGEGSFTMLVPSAKSETPQRDRIAHVYAYNALLAANQSIAVFVIKEIRRVVPNSGQAAYEVSGPDLMHELTYRSIGENVIATNVQTFMAASTYGRETTLTVQANAGATTITIADTTGWVVGNLVDVRLNSNSWHETTITNIAGSVITLADAIPTGQQADIDNVTRTRILQLPVWDDDGFIDGAIVTVDLFPANGTHTTTIADIDGTTVTLTDAIPENRTAATGNPVSYPGGATALTNDADEGDTDISVSFTTGMSIGAAISVALDAAPLTHSALIDGTPAGNVITMTDPIPWGRAAPYQFVVHSKRPALDDVEQIMDFAPATWTNPGGGTPNGSYITGAGETVYEALEQARQQGGGHFRMVYDGGVARELEWVTFPDSSGGMQLVMPDSATEAQMTNPDRGIILSISQDWSEPQKEAMTRIYARDANNDTFTLAEGYVTPASGMTVNWASGLITNSDAETGGAARIERYVRFGNIRPEDDTDAAALQAAITLYKAAEWQLLWAQALPKFFNIVCVTHSAVGLKPYNVVVANYIGPGFALIDEVLTIVEVRYQIGQDGILYTHLVATDSAGAISQRLTDADYVAQTIQRHDTALRHLSTGRSGGSTSVSAVESRQHHDLLGLEDDDHTLYLREDGGRTLSGNLPVASGITIDGVDVSAHAGNPAAHHDPVTAGNGISLSGQQVAVDLAAPSGLEFSGGQLRLADSVAGNGLGIASKVLSINLATPSGLQISSDELQLADSVAGDGLVISSKVLAVGAGNGLTVNGNDVALTTPGTLSVSSTNNPAGNHSHAVTASDNPGAATQLLKSSAAGYLQLIRLGLNVAPTVPLHVAAATEQFRIEYNTSNYAALTVASDGTLTVAPTGNLDLDPAGDVVFNPTGNDVLPENNYDLNLGLINKKYLTLHAAELWVETLVAQNTIATIGGRILVGPTTTLTRDMAAAQTYFFVKHNQMRKADVAYSEAGGQVEFMTPGGLGLVAASIGSSYFEIADDWVAFFVTSLSIRIEDGVNDGTYTVTAVSYQAGTVRTRITVTPAPASTSTLGSTITWAQQSASEYCYLSVTRNLDGSGANTWYAGDAIFNTGSVGKGFIDLYSTSGVKSGSGPTISGNVRNSTTFNDWTPHWAVGNLNGLYGYGTDTFGVAAGKYSTTTSYLTADETNGIRMMRGSTQWARWFANGDILIGQAAASQNNVWITSGGVQLRTNTTVKIDLQADGDVFIGRDTSAAATTALAIFNNSQTYNSQSVAAGDIIIGDNSSSKANIFWDQSDGKLNFRGGNTTQAYIDTDGAIVGAAGRVRLDSTGLRIQVTGSFDNAGSLRFLNTSDTTTYGLLQANTAGNLNLESGPVAAATLNLLSTSSTTTQPAIITINAENSTDSIQTILKLTSNTSVSSFYFYSLGPNQARISINNPSTPDAILDIDQNAEDDPIIYCRSSDVAHAITDVLPTDVYGGFRKAGNTDGGLDIQGATEQEIAFSVSAYYTTGDTGKATTANGAIQMTVQKKSGAGLTTPATNENLLVVRSATNTRFIVDAEGDTHSDGTANTYDEYDDVGLLRSINLALNPAGLIQDEFDRFVTVNRDLLQKSGLVTFNDDGHHFVNQTGIQRLAVGAIWQMHKRISQLEKLLEEKL